MIWKRIQQVALIVGIAGVSQSGQAAGIQSALVTIELGTTNNLTAEGGTDWRVWSDPTGQKDDGGGSAVGLIGDLGQVGMFATTSSVPMGSTLEVTWSDGIATNVAGSTQHAIWGRDALDDSTNPPPAEVDIGEGFTFTVTVPQAGAYQMRVYGTLRRIWSRYTAVVTDGLGSVTNSPPRIAGSPANVDAVLNVLFETETPNATVTVDYLYVSDRGSGGEDHLGIKAATLNEVQLAPVLVSWGGGEMATNGTVSVNEIRGPSRGGIDSGFGFNGQGFGPGLPLWVTGVDTNDSYAGPAVYGGAAAVAPTNEQAFFQRRQVEDGVDEIWLRAGNGPGQVLGGALLFETVPVRLQDLESAQLVTSEFRALAQDARLLITAGTTQYVSEAIGWNAVGLVDFADAFDGLQWATYTPGEVTEVDADVFIEAAGLNGASELELSWDSVGVRSGTTYQVWSNPDVRQSNGWSAVAGPIAATSPTTTVSNLTLTASMDSYAVLGDVVSALDMRFETAIDTNTFALLPGTTELSQIGVVFEATASGGAPPTSALATFRMSQFLVRGTPIP